MLSVGKIQLIMDRRDFHGIAMEWGGMALQREREKKRKEDL
jgi:hypothetical protein